MKYSIVIPTYNRIKDLESCLDSVNRQTKIPEEILIVDDGAVEVVFIEKWKNIFQSKNTTLRYYKKDHQKERRGLSESKNIAINMVSHPVAFIFDDDLILEEKFCEEVMNVWENNVDQRLIGVGGLIINSRRVTVAEKIFHRFFGLSSKFNWDVNAVGYQVWDEGITKVEKSFYTHGGAGSLNIGVTKKIGFSTFSGGRTGLEDVDFCLRAKKEGYYFLINHKAKTVHNQSPVAREKMFLLGVKESVNRKEIFKRLGQHDLIGMAWFAWASLGWVIRQFLSFNFRKAFGMIAGFLKF